MELAIFIIRSPYNPYSICLRGTIVWSVVGSGDCGGAGLGMNLAKKSCEELTWHNSAAGNLAMAQEGWVGVGFRVQGLRL